MKTPRIVNAVGHIDDAIVLDAINSKKKKNRWVKWGTMAACFAVVVIAGVVILTTLIVGDAVNSDQTDGRYKDFTISTESAAIVWPWEHLAESERHYETEINGIKYEKTSGYTVSEKVISDKIGTYNIIGYDGHLHEQPTVTCDVYQLKNINQTQFVAVKIADSYYLFETAVYNPPQTLGELFERVDLSQFLKLERFSENGSGPEANYFILNNDDEYVWEVISDCQSAVFIDQNQEYWHMYDRNFISFSVSSEALGIYKQEITITEDGYLMINVFHWGYLFDIGEGAAEKIIKYAKDNSKEAEYEPYNNSICGKIIEISDGYILVDDSVLCKDEADGITYKILADDIRISRYIDRGVIKVDDIVQITYNGEIDEQNSNTISSATSISDVDIFYEDEIEEQNINKENSTASITVSKIVESDNL